MNNNYEGTPEQYLSVSKSENVNSEAINCALDRAKSISYLIQSHFNDPDGGKWNDKIMSDACWTLQGLLDQIEILMEGKS